MAEKNVPAGTSVVGHGPDMVKVAMSYKSGTTAHSITFDYQPSTGEVTAEDAVGARLMHLAAAGC